MTERTIYSLPTCYNTLAEFFFSHADFRLRHRQWREKQIIFYVRITLYMYLVRIILYMYSVRIISIYVLVS
jgi:hypothetical protein